MTHKILGQTKNLTPRWNTFVALVVVLAASLFRPTDGIAQSGAGSIQGTIQDSSDAALPGCSIHVVNQSTGVAYDTTSNSIGFYSAPGLFAGNYTLTFSAPGMKKYQASVALQNAQIAVISPKLTVGEVTEQVTVLGNDIQLATYDSGTIGTQLDSKRIDQLPQNGRNVLGLAAATTPGLEAGGQRANGLMPEGLEYTQHGAPMTNRNFGGEGNSTQAQLPDPDAVQEVKIETLNSRSTKARSRSPIAAAASAVPHTSGLTDTLRLL